MCKAQVLTRKSAYVLTSTSLLENLDEEKQTLVIPEGQERSVHYKMRAKSLLGSADLKITASLVKRVAPSHRQQALDRNTLLHHISSGYSTNATLTLSPDRRLYSDYRVSDAAVSPTTTHTGVRPASLPE